MVRPKRRDGSRCQKLGVHGSMNFKKGKILEEFLFPSPKKLGVHTAHAPCALPVPPPLKGDVRRGALASLTHFLCFTCVAV